MARREGARRMNMWQLLLAVVAAIATARANIAPAGPYLLKTDYFGACDDGEYPDQIVNISLIWDDEVKETAFSGYLNKTYDDLCDECELEISVYKWGSTGGWTKFYSLSFTKPFDYLKDHFPEVYELLLVPMGIIKKPLSPGIYYMHRYWTVPITLKSFVSLPYGQYKLYNKGTKDGKRPTCTQLVVTITEVGLDHDPVSLPPYMAMYDGFLDCQGFCTIDNRFIPREIAYRMLRGKRNSFIASGVFIILWTTPFYEPSAKWLMENHHSLSMGSAGVLVEMAVCGIPLFVLPASHVFVKGLEKVKWMKDLLPEYSVHNIEDKGCPSLPPLREKS